MKKQNLVPLRTKTVASLLKLRNLAHHFSSGALLHVAITRVPLASKPDGRCENGNQCFRPAILWLRILSVFRYSQNARALYKSDVAIERQTRKRFGSAAGRRPADFQAIDPRARTNTQDLTRIMGGQITPPTHFQLAPLQVSRIPSEAGSDRIRIGLFADQMNTKPVIPTRGLVFQQQGRTIVNAHQHIDSAIVVKIPNS